MKALVTGIAGFAGCHLAEFLLAKNFTVLGIVREKDNPNLVTIEKKLELYQADLLNQVQVKEIVAKTKPEIIFHLAGFSAPRLSFARVQPAFEANVFSSINLFEAIVASKLKPTVVNIGSSEEYGITDAKKISEQVALNPASPYAVSKIAQDYLGWFYFKSYGIQVIRLRPFNHIGPRQQESFATSSFAKQIAAIEKGLQDSVIYVGNLAAVRDFTDVRDMVRAYFLAAEKCQPGEVYNIGTGKPCSLAKILSILLSFAKVKIKIKVDQNLLRVLDVPSLVCNPAKFIKNTGWQPKIPIEKTLADILEFWRSKVHG